MSFEEAYKEFKEYAKKRHKKQSFNNLLYDFKTKVLPYFKGRDIYSLSEKDILKWKDIIANFNYSNKYNAKIYYVFCEFFDYCYLYLNLERNYVRDVGSFKRHHEVHKSDYYTLSEFNTFIKGFDNYVYEAYYTFMFFTGTRPSEAMALKFSDIHGKYISINKSIERRGKRELISCKNVYSNRDILLSKRVLKYLKVLYKMYGSKNDYFIFGGDKPLSSSTCDRYKRIACERMNIRPITQHQFRHSYATFLISNGLPINNVSKLLGHSNIQVTSKVYVHQDLSQEKRVLSTLNSKSFSFNNLLYNFKRKLDLLKHFSMF